MKKTPYSNLILLPLMGALLFGCGKPKAEEGKDGADKPSSVKTAGIPVEQRDPKRMWCKEHNRYEDRCWLCHPELQDKKRLFCNEHSLYEDECFLCNPSLEKPKKTEGGGAAAK
ncbi:MAG: hypothetical protein WAX69_17175 [Victivallales bacterium]